MSEEEKTVLEAILQSVCRIEAMINVIIEAKYGTNEAKRVYKEITDIVEKEIKLT